MKNALIILAIGICIGYVGTQDMKDEQAQEQRYCEMRAIWEKNKDIEPTKRPGWPNFKPEVECK